MAKGSVLKETSSVTTTIINLIHIFLLQITDASLVWHSTNRHIDNNTIDNKCVYMYSILIKQAGKPNLFKTQLLGQNGAWLFIKRHLSVWRLHSEWLPLCQSGREMEREGNAGDKWEHGNVERERKSYSPDFIGFLWSSAADGGTLL